MPCSRALDAAAGAHRRRAARSAPSALAAGRPATDMHVALHVGDVLYGNIGSRDRLDFTVVGPAVNEVARIEALCRSLEQQVIVSSAFAEDAGPARERLVSLGRYALKGVRRPGGAVHARPRLVIGPRSIAPSPEPPDRRRLMQQPEGDAPC